MILDTTLTVNDVVNREEKWDMDLLKNWINI